MADSDHVYKTIVVTGTSESSIDDAIHTALRRTGESVHNLRWFEVGGIRGQISAGDVDHYQVTLKIGFTLED